MVDKKRSGNGTFQAKPVCLISFSRKRLVCLAGCRSGEFNLEPRVHCLPTPVTHHLLSTVFQAMKGEKGIPGVTVGDGLGEELTDETFSKWRRRRSAVNARFLSFSGCFFFYSHMKLLPV